MSTWSRTHFSVLGSYSPCSGIVDAFPAAAAAVPWWMCRHPERRSGAGSSSGCSVSAPRRRHGQGGAGVGRERHRQGPRPHRPAGPAAPRFHVPLLLGDRLGPRPARPRDYRLTVGGLVDHPATLSLADLGALPQTSLTRDFQCVTGWRVPAVHWSGVRLADVLDHVGVQRSAHRRALHQLRRHLHREPHPGPGPPRRRPRRHLDAAAPRSPTTTAARCGSTSRRCTATRACKWLESIELTAAVQPGYWEDRGYDVDGWVGDSNGRSDRRTS